MNFKKYIDKIKSNKNTSKILMISFLLIVVIIIIFLIANLLKFYNANINPKKNPELLYVFEQNTIGFNFENDNSEIDISEQFLSYGISYGIDVSEWQGDIDWNKVASTGISFAMIRCGFRQTVGSEIKEDAQFRKNIDEATKAGLKVGVYFFGTAKNEEEAIEEAEFTINLIKDYNLTYPVAYDFESFNQGRLKNINPSILTDNILTFTEMVSSYGYETMVYTYKNAFEYTLDTGKLDGKLIWLAHFTDNQTDYRGNYNMWQYTSEGKVDGIKTNVDLNISYFKYVTDESQITPNPNYKKAPLVNFEKVEEKIKTKKSAIMRTSPTTSMPNKLGTLPKDTLLTRIAISEKFSEVIYNDRVIYIENKDIVIAN